MATHARVCLIGPESTGKSQVAERLARELSVPWAPEYAREYALNVKRELTKDDVDPIARGTIARAKAPILDTDLISTVVYARYYYGSCPEWIEEEARARRAGLYLLLDTDIEWHPDPARDAATPEMREDLFVAMRAALEEFDCRFEVISGTFDERLERARGLVAGALGR